MHRVGCLTCCQGVRGIGPVTSKWIDEYCRYGACWAGLGWAGLAWDEQRPPVSPQQLSDQGASEASHDGVRQCTAKVQARATAAILPTLRVSHPPRLVQGKWSICARCRRIWL